jgi:hypothetical protein
MQDYAKLDGRMGAGFVRRMGSIQDKIWLTIWVMVKRRVDETTEHQKKRWGAEIVETFSSTSKSFLT